MTRRFGPVDRRAIAILAAIVACTVALAVGFAIAVHVDDTASIGEVGSVEGTMGVFMAVDPTIPNAYMDALFKGPIVVRDGCVLMGGGSGRPSLPIWPHGFTATEESGRLVIKDTSGNIVVSDGGDISMGGGFVAQFQPAGKVMPTDYQVTQV